MEGSIGVCLTRSTRELYLREAGNSRIADVPWDIDRTFLGRDCADHLRLLQNAIRWAANEPPPVVVEGPGLIDVTVWKRGFVRFTRWTVIESRWRQTVTSTRPGSLDSTGGGSFAAQRDRVPQQPQVIDAQDVPERAIDVPRDVDDAAAARGRGGRARACRVGTRG